MSKKRKKDFDKNIDAIIKTVEKKYGKGCVFYGGDKAFVKDINVIPTGLFGLNKALGIGGIPIGRLVELFGNEGSGKTTMALFLMSMAQREDVPVAFIDVEHALDIKYAEACGVDINNVLFSQPDSAEQAFDIAERLMYSKIGFIVVDSVASLVTRAELAGEMGDTHVAVVARFMSNNMKKFAGACSKNNVSLIFINQTRSRIGIRFGNPETTTGGNALKFHSSLRLKISSIGKYKVGDEILGNKTRINVVKNKMAPPFKEAEFLIRFGEGIDYLMEMIDVAEGFGIITKSGAWYSYGDVRLGQGKEGTRDFLIDNEDLYGEIYRICGDTIEKEMEG